MSEREYTEPTNEQLANFLSVYGKSFMGAHFEVEPYILERMMERRPELREIGLRHHRRFQDEIYEHTEKMEKGGELQCEHIRPNGKKCPNRNEAGSLYCGLHKEA